MASPGPRLELVEVTRRFPGVVALDRVSLDLYPGEVHALVGENGAGKSTLLNIISGVLTPDAGQFLFEGQGVVLKNPVAARRLGVVAVHQEAELFESLSLAENLALSYGLPTSRWGTIRWGEVLESAQQATAATGESFDVRQPAGRLSVGHRHMAQVAAAVARRASVLVLDEPTSALSGAESNWLFGQIARLKEAGVSILYISHRQDEIFQLADRITVLRDGRRVWTGSVGETNRRALVEAMVGRAMTPSSTPREVLPTSPNRSAEVRLEALRVTDAQGRFREVSLKIHAGEIVGVYGLVGSGRSEFAQGLFGLRQVSSGSATVDGRAIPLGNPGAAVTAGLAYVPEDRLRQGVCRGLSVRENLLLTMLNQFKSIFLPLPKRERAIANREADQLGVRRRSVAQPIGQLSGGNQQKVVLGRWLLTQPRVLMLDEPTRGVDVAAKAEIHRLIRAQADAGTGVLMISSELPEVLEHADRIVVFSSGEVAGEFPAATATAADIAAAAMPIDMKKPTSALKPSTRSTRPRLRSEWGLLLAIAALAGALSITSPAFATSSNIANLFTTASVTAILALGATMVIIAGGIDISVGALLALSAAVCGLVMKSPYAPGITIPLGILAGLGIGAAGGALNAALALIGRVHPIVVTLGMMTVYRGLLISLTGGNEIVGLPSAFDQLALGRFIGINGAIWTMLLAIVAVQLWLTYARYGRYQYAVGSSPTAARLAGISQGRVWLVSFAAGGVLAALAGIVELAKSGSMQSGLGTGYELQAIAAAVIGGTAVSGGRGSAWGTFLGAMLLSLVSNALVLWQVSRYHSGLVIGGLILAAVVLDRGWRRLEQ